MKKEDIINNLRDYTADDIVAAINSGIVTFYELSKSGQFTPLMKKRVKEKLDNQEKQSVDIDSNNVNNKSGMIKPDITLSEVNDVPDEIVIDKQNQSDEELKNSVQTVDIESVNINDSCNYNQPPSNKRMFRAPFSFKGRIRRLEYCLSYLFLYILFFPINILPESQITDGMAIFYLLVFIPALWFIYAQGAKRCHDRGNSGWWQLIPFYGFWMAFADGEPNDNKYGDSPKY